MTARLTLGRFRKLQQISDLNGVFAISAIDHRDPFRRMMKPIVGHENADWQAVVDEKALLAQELSPVSTAILLDPLYAAGPLIERRVVPGHVGIIMAREQSGYGEVDEGRVTRLEPAWSAAAIDRLGAQGVKLLLQYHPRAGTASRQEDLVARVAEDCHANDIPLILEPIAYPPEAGQARDDPAFARTLPDVVVETARRLVPLGADVLKAEFPCHPAHETDETRMAEACRAVTEAAGVPWVLLSAGVGFHAFQRQVEIACEAGASGFLAGRALWQDALEIPDRATRQRYVRSHVVSRMECLAAIASGRATPWWDRIADSRKPQAGEGWGDAYGRRFGQAENATTTVNTDRD